MMNRRTAYFEVIHEDYHEDGNPYSATLLTDERIPDKPDKQRIRRLRNWLIALSLAIVCMTLLSYVAIGLHSAARAEVAQKSMEILNAVCLITITVIMIPFMVVVHLLSRALGNSFGLSIIYLVFSSSMFHARNQSMGYIHPLGVVIIPFILCIQAHNALLDQQSDETDSF